VFFAVYAQSMQVSAVGDVQAVDCIACVAIEAGHLLAEATSAAWSALVMSKGRWPV
jgi:hypothetical protein